MLHVVSKMVDCARGAGSHWDVGRGGRYCCFMEITIYPHCCNIIFAQLQTENATEVAFIFPFSFFFLLFPFSFSAALRFLLCHIVWPRCSRQKNRPYPPSPLEWHGAPCTTFLPPHCSSALAVAALYAVAATAINAMRFILFMWLFPLLLLLLLFFYYYTSSLTSWKFIVWLPSWASALPTPMWIVLSCNTTQEYHFVGIMLKYQKYILEIFW